MKVVIADGGIAGLSIHRGVLQRVLYQAAVDRLGAPEQVIDVVEHRAPAGFENLDDVISSEQLAAIIGGYVRAAGLVRRSTR